MYAGCSSALSADDAFARYGLPREIWNFGKRGEWCFDAQEKMINLRYRLLPYIYSTSWDVSHNDGTFMRPLVMDFAADSKTHEVGGFSFRTLPYW